MHEVGSAGLSEVKVKVKVEGVPLVFERKALHLVSAFQVAMKKGGKVVSWT